MKWSVSGRRPALDPCARAAARLTPAALAAAAALALPAAALAQSQARGGTPGEFRGRGIPVRVTEMSTLRVSPRGVVTGPGPVFGGVTDACNVTASHTDANFTGGSYTAQAGFAQQEVAATSYTIAASEFPIRINLTEVILVTSNATEQTVTRWSMLFYSGTPATGTLIDSFSSDDVILPHARVGPGTAGVNIQFSVDPNDPEQIIIPNNGSNTFTIAFRIDQHNEQTGNPCFSGPPTCCNAFPCTDVSGLQAPTQNWLWGLNCGGLGCPPNGGWSTFGNLSSFCRPSGDWVMRAVWSGVNCTPGVGACCKIDGTCELMAAGTCHNGGGTYQGDGTSCGSVNCPQPTAACCFSNGSCLMRTQASCTGLNGTWLGVGTSCSGSSCPTGACCMPNGSCTPGLTAPACTAQGGTFQGAGSACGNCPQPTGACCTSGGGCDLLTQADCTLIGGTWQGAGTPCTACTPTGACCTTGAGCGVLTQAECTLIGGTWQGAGTTCAACSPACYANCDSSTAAPVLNVQDFSCFLTRYAGAEPYANCDQSTTPPVLNVQDFSCFLTKYAAGCP